MTQDARCEVIGGRQNDGGTPAHPREGEQCKVGGVIILIYT